MRLRIPDKQTYIISGIRIPKDTVRNDSEKKDDNLSDEYDNLIILIKPTIIKLQSPDGKAIHS